MLEGVAVKGQSAAVEAVVAAAVVAVKWIRKIYHGVDPQLWLLFGW